MSDAPSPPARNGHSGWFDSLSVRLFLVTIFAILLVEFLVFLPSAANYRDSWLTERVQAARIAALSLEAAPSRMVSEELSNELLERAEVLAVAELSDDMREQILPPSMPLDGPMKEVDLMEEGFFGSIGQTVATWNAPEGRMLIIHAMGSAPGRVLEIIVPEAPLKAGLADFGWRIMGISLLISLSAGAIIYLLLFFLVVRPMQRVTDSVIQFQKDPGAWTKRLSPTPRKDEIGRAQNALADMESAVSNSFRQRERLAQLGEAVAKINHDLRNTLATAQLTSDALSASDDPRVQRAVPRLERALERAINLASETLKYGRSRTQPAKLQPVKPHQVIAEAAMEALAPWPEVEFRNAVPESLVHAADPDHLHRIATNLIRNAAEAMQGEGTITVNQSNGAIDFEDTGPGLAPKARNNLFKPFAASSRRDGSGLGLALSRDLARSMGGDLTLVETGASGTHFRLALPDDA
ncbi:sensor histidine kinase [Henriciella aquimarina]|uniref:sensor histidine kinase n=1 Tax=Henriciella aquimarina TaxID=545261 RepID=UPI00146B46D1|nr:HAMP domain-containing sensor histidine kinase [Henriciella aquimarina]